jgi:N-acetylglutamate synthase-like GNAT family acetyltransferase
MVGSGESFLPYRSLVKLDLLTNMTEFSLRPATVDDFSAIRELIRKVHINPTGLDWPRFVVAVDRSGKMLGCGQLKVHDKDVIELASIAVIPGYRYLGIARAIIEKLTSKAPRPLYLTCRFALRPFYEKWGFRVIKRSEMPCYFRRLDRLTSLFSPLVRLDGGLFIMRLL